ncbi:hypothetical protein ACNQGP_07235 [Flavobacterium sp. GT2N3]|uniref:hypothetical protein n=1 Tax=unclassified Flavobacterium TaxID=196869 RepID=UPI003AABB281
MSNFNLAYSDRIRYTLYNKSQGSLVITEPIGYANDEKELARHEQYHGIISRFSNSSKFIGSGKDYIQLIYDIEGINAEIKMKREERHPQTDDWTLSYSGYLDLSTWETENNQISIKFNSGGLEQLLKARESEQVEIDRNTTIDGKSIAALAPITVAMDGRRIFLKTKYEVAETDNSLQLHNESNAGNIRSQTAGIPFAVINKSHESAQTVLDGGVGNKDNGDTGMMFFAVSDRKRRLRVVIDQLTFNYKIDRQAIKDDSNTYFKISLTKFKSGFDYATPERIPLLSFNYSQMIENHDRNFALNYSAYIDLDIGESLSVEAFQNVNFNFSNNARLNITLSNISGKLSVDEDSFFEKSQTKAVLAHELLDRLVTIGTNKEKAFYSDFLGRTDLGYAADGLGSLTGITHGFWIRAFGKSATPADALKEDNLFKPLTTSFKDAVAALDAVWNVGIGIETVGNKERVRLEELSYFYNNNVTIRLPFQVKNVKRSVATNYYYSGLEFGSEKGGDYQEAMGLDEYNTKSTFTTIINRVKEVYSRVSKYRTDSYGMEFARRKPKSLNDTEDTPYDTDNFMLDLFKNPVGIFEQRLWFNKYDRTKDDFKKEPTGVFNPESATNLRFSPFNCLLRHSWWFGGGLKKYATDYVSYGSSVASSQLKTKLTGQNEYAENGNIVNSELMKARFFPEWIEFEHICDFEVMQMVEGKTVILGKEIMNFYGLVEFINENKDIEKGFLMNLKPNNKGVWAILKANR